MNDLNNEIEEASVGTMMPIVTPEDTLSKASPVSVDEAFEALRLNTPEDDYKDPENEFDESVSLVSDDDILYENGIESVLYERMREWNEPGGVIFEESELKDFGESAQIDDDIKDTIKTLNEKGYETKYSCSGHPSARLKSDGKRDGIKDKKLYSTAKIVFAKDYDFGNIPDCWEEKKLDEGNTGIYVKGPTFKIINGLPVNQFYKWKAKYMRNLRKWADDLPDAKDSGKKEEKIEEGVNEVFEDLLIDLA